MGVIYALNAFGVYFGPKTRLFGPMADKGGAVVGHAAVSGGGYTSGRSLWRGMPVARSTSNTRIGGTRFH